MQQLERKRIYWVWADMLNRCRNPNHKQFQDYGGRGITVCDQWKKFENFLSDMGARPDGGMIERKDNNLGYEPLNCTWATRKEQNSNRRNCIFVTHHGERVTLREFCRRHEIRYRPIVKRIQDRGWPIKLALVVPVGCDRDFFSKQAAE